jgi:hypothetical protein
VELNCQTSAALDDLNGEYINMMHQNDLPITYAGHLLSDFQRFLPRRSGQLRASWAYFNNWRKEYTPHRAMPLSREIFIATAAYEFVFRRMDMAPSFW